MSEKLQVIILKGLQGSGKTTWAKEQLKLFPNKYKRVNKDDLREMVDASIHSEENEKVILRIQDELILEFLKEGFSVIVDNTNLAPKHETRIKCLVKNKADVVIKDEFLYVPLEVCIERDSKRDKPVGEKVIRQTANQFSVSQIGVKSLDKDFTQKKQNRYPKVEYVDKLHDCIIVDIDGTVALMQNRSPYDLDRVDEDLVNRPIQLLIQFIRSNVTKLHIFFVSGREDKCREKTEKWLHENWFSFDALLMRKTSDFRKDCIVKKEIYDEHIKGKFNVLYVLDDRSQVVKMWREQGLTVLQVNDGDF
jgi:predicted kinase